MSNIPGLSLGWLFVLWTFGGLSLVSLRVELNFGWVPLKSVMIMEAVHTCSVTGSCLKCLLVRDYSN